MIISLIAAMGNNRVIGIDNRLPWRLPADMKHFRAITMGKPVLMGRKTFESIGKALPGRANIVVTQDRHFHSDGVSVAHSIEEALAMAETAGTTEVLVIGGASFYAQFLPKAQRLYITEIHNDFQGDAFFPAWEPAEWREVQRYDHAPDGDNAYAYSFVTLERRLPSA